MTDLSLTAVKTKKHVIGRKALTSKKPNAKGSRKSQFENSRRKMSTEQREKK